MVQLGKNGTGRTLFAQTKEYADSVKEIATLEGKITKATYRRREMCEAALAAIDALDGDFAKVDANQAQIDARIAASKQRAKAERDMDEWSRRFRHAKELAGGFLTGPASAEKHRRDLAKLEAAKPIAPENIDIPDVPKPLDRAESEELVAKLKNAVATVRDFTTAAAEARALRERRDELAARIVAIEGELAAGIEAFDREIEITKNFAGFDNP